MKPERDSFFPEKTDAKEGQALWAVVDLGTNTFQYVIGKKTGNGLSMPYRKKTGVKLGKGGMGKKQILPDAEARAIDALLDFKADFLSLQIPEDQIFLFGTSAFRNAGNKEEIISSIYQKTGFRVNVIDGENEAGLIFEAVSGSGAMAENKNHLITDIGGGSVEFIICKGKNPVWKKSFEIGGLRLLELFPTHEPVTPDLETKAKNYMVEILQPLWAKLREIEIENMIGCSGSFETLAAMELAKKNESFINIEEKASLEIDLDVFHFWSAYLKNISLEDRLKIPGMIPLRAEMMVAALLLIEVLLLKTKAKSLKVSTWSLKEGALLQLLRGSK